MLPRILIALPGLAAAVQLRRMADSCTSDDVSKLGDGPTLFNNMNTCVATTQGLNDDAADCAAGATGVGRACVDCFFNVFKCGVSNCAVPCVNPFGQDCVACAMATCADDFQTCTGVPGSALPPPFTTTQTTLPPTTANPDHPTPVPTEYPSGRYGIDDSDGMIVHITLDHRNMMLDFFLGLNLSPPLIPPMNASCDDIVYVFNSWSSTVTLDLASNECMKGVFDTLRAVVPSLPTGDLTMAFSKSGNAITLQLIIPFKLEYDSSYQLPEPASTTMPDAAAGLTGLAIMPLLLAVLGVL